MAADATSPSFPTCAATERCTRAKVATTRPPTMTSRETLRSSGPASLISLEAKHFDENNQHSYRCALFTRRGPDFPNFQPKRPNPRRFGNACCVFCYFSNTGLPMGSIFTSVATSYLIPQLFLVLFYHCYQLLRSAKTRNGRKFCKGRDLVIFYRIRSIIHTSSRE